MKTIDLNKPVKFKNPQPGEEKIIFSVTNYNEVTSRCYIQPLNMDGFNLIPEELVSIEELINTDEA